MKNYVFIALLAVALTACTEPQDQTILLVRAEMYDNLNALEIICEKTPNAEMRDSVCLERMAEVSKRVKYYLTPENTSVLNPVVLRLDEISVDVYKRHQSSQTKSNNRE